MGSKIFHTDSFSLGLDLNTTIFEDGNFMGLNKFHSSEDCF